MCIRDRYRCVRCGLEFEFTKSFSEYPDYERAYHRSQWDWRLELEQKVLQAENARSTIQCKVLGAYNTLLLPENGRALPGSDRRTDEE